MPMPITEAACESLRNYSGWNILLGLPGCHRRWSVPDNVSRSIARFFISPQHAASMRRHDSARPHILARGRSCSSRWSSRASRMSKQSSVLWEKYDGVQFLCKVYFRRTVMYRSYGDDRSVIALRGISVCVYRMVHRLIRAEEFSVRTSVPARRSPESGRSLCKVYFRSTCCYF
jgi:hypothetical protein